MTFMSKNTINIYKASNQIHQNIYTKIWDISNELELVYKHRKDKMSDMIIKRKFTSNGGKFNFIEGESIIFITKEYNFMVSIEILTIEPDSYDSKILKETTYGFFSETTETLCEDIHGMEELLSYLKSKLRKAKIFNFL